MRDANDVELSVAVSDRTFRDLSRLMAVMLRPYEEHVSMGRRENVLRTEVYRAVDAIRWGNSVPDETWGRLDELGGGAS